MTQTAPSAPVGCNNQARQGNASGCFVSMPGRDQQAQHELRGPCRHRRGTHQEGSGGSAVANTAALTARLESAVGARAKDGRAQKAHHREAGTFLSAGTGAGAQGRGADQIGGLLSGAAPQPQWWKTLSTPIPHSISALWVESSR